MQIQKIDQKNPAFNANIIKTPYLEHGISYAKNYAQFRRANNFLNALTIIKNDKNMKTFKIDKIEDNAKKLRKPSRCQIEADGNVIPCNFWGSLNSGAQCLLAVITFVRQRYGEDVLEQVRSKKYQNYLNAEYRENLAFKAAEDEMKTSLDNIV